MNLVKLKAEQIQKSRAPAKLILSGEHAVLYGQPAVAIAINRYINTSVAWSKQTEIQFNLKDLSYLKSFTQQALYNLANNLQNCYQEFLQHRRGVTEVIQHPSQLLQYSVAMTLQKFNLSLPHGLQIRVDSDMPIGIGLGSSAASILGVLYALREFFAIDWAMEDLIFFATQVEHLQHGKSSGLDLHLVNHGGCVWFQNGVAQTRKLPRLDLQIVNTGVPLSTTGQCVTEVAKILATDQILLDDFGVVAHEIDQCLFNNSLVDFRQAIQFNHKLLQKIGVVPVKVANFIADIERAGGAAKICGAGAVAGDQAGIVLITADTDVTSVAQKHGYCLENIQVDINGTKNI